MAFSPETEAFIKDFVRDLREDSVAVFAGAGMSKSAGCVDWPGLLEEIAEELGLRIELEHDLISLAQFHVNSKRNSGKLAKKIIQEFSEHAELTDTHRILARLPIKTYWTTNYDTLIEDALASAFKVADVKHSVGQLNNTRPKRDAVVYKMHGDVTLPQEAILYKEQYERYYRTHEPFVTALSGDLVSKTFLFIGFSFSDPNLDYVLSRLHASNRRNHYCFMRRELAVAGDDADLVAYKKRKQDLRVEDLKRFGIQTVLVNDYAEIPLILQAVEVAYRKKTIFISGSAEKFEPWDTRDAQVFLHKLSSALIRKNFRVVTGFGWGVGSAVINGALEAIFSEPGKFSEDQLVMRPFPQFATSTKPLPQLWEEYRHRMISLCGVAVFVFGNKVKADGSLVLADGVQKEFAIALEHGVLPIPVRATGYMAGEICRTIEADLPSFYSEPWMRDDFSGLSSEIEVDKIIHRIIAFAERAAK